MKTNVFFFLALLTIGLAKVATDSEASKALHALNQIKKESQIEQAKAKGRSMAQSQICHKEIADLKCHLSKTWESKAKLFAKTAKGMHTSFKKNLRLIHKQHAAVNLAISAKNVTLAKNQPAIISLSHDYNTISDLIEHIKHGIQKDFGAKMIQVSNEMKNPLHSLALKLTSMFASEPAHAKNEQNKAHEAQKAAKAAGKAKAKAAEKKQKEEAKAAEDKAEEKEEEKEKSKLHKTLAKAIKKVQGSKAASHTTVKQETKKAKKAKKAAKAKIVKHNKKLGKKDKKRVIKNTEKLTETRVSEVSSARKQVGEMLTELATKIKSEIKRLADENAVAEKSAEATIASSHKLITQLQARNIKIKSIASHRSARVGEITLRLRACARAPKVQQLCKEEAEKYSKLSAHFNKGHNILTHVIKEIGQVHHTEKVLAEAK